MFYAHHIVFIFQPLLGWCLRHSVLGCPVSIHASVRGRKEIFQHNILGNFSDHICNLSGELGADRQD